jgi:acyl carrier protein
MDTLERLRELAAKELAIDPGALDPAAPLDSLGIDSLMLIDFMFKVEEEFGAVTLTVTHLSRLERARGKPAVLPGQNERPSFQSGYGK